MASKPCWHLNSSIWLFIQDDTILAHYKPKGTVINSEITAELTLAWRVSLCCKACWVRWEEKGSVKSPPDRYVLLSLKLGQPPVSWDHRMLSSDVGARLVQFHMSRIMLENHTTLRIKGIACGLSDVYKYGCVLRFLESLCLCIDLMIRQSMFIRWQYSTYLYKVILAESVCVWLWWSLKITDVSAI